MASWNRTLLGTALGAVLVLVSQGDANAARFELSVSTSLDNRLGGLTTGTFEIYGSFTDITFDDGFLAAGLRAIDLDITADAGTVITSVTSALPTAPSAAQPIGFANTPSHTTVTALTGGGMNFFSQQLIDLVAYAFFTDPADREYSIIELVGILDNDPLTADPTLLEQTRGQSFDLEVLIATGTFDLTSLDVTSRLDVVDAGDSEMLVGELDVTTGLPNWDGESVSGLFLDTAPLEVIGDFSGIIPEPTSCLVWSGLFACCVLRRQPNAKKSRRS